MVRTSKTQAIRLELLPTGKEGQAIIYASNDGATDAIELEESYEPSDAEGIWVLAHPESPEVIKARARQVPIALVTVDGTQTGVVTFSLAWRGADEPATLDISTPWS